MKQTREIIISEKVFTSEDVRRIASILDKQTRLSSESGHTTDVKYEVKFSNNTTLSSDSPEVFSDESLNAPARPVGIRMSFHDYKLDRHISLSFDHGDSTYGNLAVISGSEPTWLSENFLNLQEVIDRVQPQSFWFRKHKTLLLNLIALGIGSMGVLILQLIIFSTLDHLKVIKPLPSDSPWRQAITLAMPLLYIMGWFWRWAVGFFWGAFGVRQWLLSVWPSIEFDFGLLHLRSERRQRQRLGLVVTLIILPTALTIIIDLIRAVF
jgi:hypothetical protein